ncbi:general receptor for phosphoinositides 1-associated scaffold protein isoform X2 [Gouania willdenowi]|uniref:general receptor for phosphoinositides 1-associated scaffold protein isoform X2 n=1 Tax=Gouania willdenowi TaxID=441366 RepID=UPI001056E13F|nr:cytohesin-interacting protein isoform X2 [Gouania willdenowi]
MQSIMNLTGQQQEEGGQKSSPLDLTLRKKASVWYRRSLRGIYGQYTQNSSSLPRGCKPRQSRSNSLVDHNPQRITIVLNKEDHETFGFEIQTRPLRLRSSSSVEMCTFVCRVHEDSVAESAGLTAGDIIATINGVSTEGSSHQRILDLIRESTNILKMETVYGNVMKRLELEKRMNLLKVTLMTPASIPQKARVPPPVSFPVKAAAGVCRLIVIVCLMMSVRPVPAVLQASQTTVASSPETFLHATAQPGSPPAPALFIRTSVAPAAPVWQAAAALSPLPGR